MKVAISPSQKGYRSAPGLFRGQLVESHDSPERLEALLAIVTDGGYTVCEAPTISRSLLESVHDVDFLQFLEHGPEEWHTLSGSTAPLMPNIFPTRHFPSRKTPHPLAKAGYYLGDTVTPLAGDTWAAIHGSASAAAHAAELVLAGDLSAYALCRPSGHHAHTDMAQGFCYLNNAAIAAAVARSKHQRVAIIDIDVHHGNGTQQIFYDRPDVLVISLHADPAVAYPFFVGHEDEKGEGAGEGFNINIPLPKDTGDAVYLNELDRALEKIRSFDPGMLVVSLGLDAHEADRLGIFKLTNSGFEEIARRIKAVGVPTVLIQEGGYTIPVIGSSLKAVLGTFR